MLDCSGGEDGFRPWRNIRQLVRASRQDEMFCTARLVRIAGEFDGAVPGRGLAADEPLRVKGAVSACAVGDAFGDAAAVGVHKPRQVEHLSKGDGAKVEVKPGDKNVVARIKKVAREGEEAFNELAFIDGDALNSLADILFRIGDSLQNLPRVAGLEFDGVHFAVAHGIAAFNHARPALGVVVGLENHNVLAGVLTPHIGAPQKLRGLVASHRTQKQFQLPLHVIPPEMVWFPAFHPIAFGACNGNVGRLEHFRFWRLLPKWTDVLSHPFRKIREMDGAPRILLTLELKML